MLFNVIKCKFLKDVLNNYFVFFDLFKTRKDLLFEIIKRELKERYVGQFLGTAWFVVNPLLLILLYIFIFTNVFKTRYSFFLRESDYVIFFLSGFIPWMSIQDLMNRSCSIICQNANLVKQVIFPIEVLPIKTALVCMITQIVSFVFTLFYIWWVKDFLLYGCIFMFFLFIIQLFFMIGLSYIISSIGVYVKDIKEVISFFCSLNMFISPIFYSEKMLPAYLEYALYFNPFSYVFWCYQDVLFFNKLEHKFSLIIFVLVSMITFIFGCKLFFKAKIGFADYL